jgi:hypothetical protein
MTTTLSETPQLDCSWFLTNPTFLGVATFSRGLDGVKCEWTTDLHSFVGKYPITLTFDETSGDVVASGLPSSVSNEGDAPELAALATSISEAIRYHRRLAQRAHQHPADGGLVHRGLGEANERDADSALAILGSRWNYTPVDGGIAPSSEASGGWFAPNADASVFGTPFVYAINDDTDGPERTVWTLGQVGIGRTPIASANWNNKDECQNLFRIAAENDVETLTAMTSLTLDAGSFREARTKQEQKRAISFARDAWKRHKTRVKPRIVENAIVEAIKSSITLSDKQLRFLVTPEKLDNADHLTANSMINAAVNLLFICRGWKAETDIAPLSPSQLSPLLNKLNKTLQEKDLGKIVRVNRAAPPAVGRTPIGDDYYVTKIPSLFSEHRQAFGITPEDTLHTYQNGVCEPI